MTVYCHLPWTALDIKTNSSISPCCVFKGSFTGTPDEYFKSDFLNNIKNQMINNQSPKECSSCQQGELKNGHSFRLLHNKFRPELLQVVENDPTQNYVEDISIITSNICNLKCLPCFYGSYTRTQELHKLNLINFIPIVAHVDNNFFNDIKNINFKKLTITGGEPFYDRHCMNLLEMLVKDNKSKEIELDINTNCTYITESVADFLSDNFKFIQIKASIDGVGKVNDYLRYPSNWEDILKSLNLLKNRTNISILVTTTLSNLALIKYHEVIEWALDFGIDHMFLTPVQDPDELAITNLPIDIKKSLEQKYLNLKDYLLKNNNLSERTMYCIDTAINSCKNTKDYNMTPTLDWLSLHDKHRSTNCFDIFPELHDYKKT
jgi:organic radical activating enzyme